jgi:hypothetical protein
MVVDQTFEGGAWFRGKKGLKEVLNINTMLK